MTEWVFLVLLMASDGSTTREVSRPYPDAVSCERARGQVIMAYRDGSRKVPEAGGVMTKACTPQPKPVRAR